MSAWDGRQANGRHELVNLLLNIGLDYVEQHEGPAARDQAQAAIDAGEYRGGINEEHGLAFLRVGTGPAERGLVAIPLDELEAMLVSMYPDPPIGTN